MPERHYDAIVLGLGAMGGAALHHLAKRGLRVLGFEQFRAGHARGSSHGQTRLIRKAYFEHPDYVPLLHRAYDLWHELEDATGQNLFEDGLGLVAFGPPDSEIIRLTLECSRKHNLRVHEVSPADLRKRYPLLREPEGYRAVWDDEGGLLYVERCVLAHLDAARSHGAALKDRQRVLEWNASPSQVSVRTARATYTADRLVICAGAWSGQVLKTLGIPLEIRRKVLFWYKEKEAGSYGMGKFPPFFYDLPYGRIYGFPALDGLGVKIADHMGGQVLDEPTPPRRLFPGDEETVQRLRAKYFPGLEARRSHYAVCMYTMTPDENFVVAVHPHHPNVSIAAGFSGHGFKFAPVIGEILADLAVDGRTRRPIEFLGVERLLSPAHA
ncbi:MAG: N-methyl-L-tryptophan oxidase [Armatimonadetes bacterium]|nr:N-methyl-L-tryptophan oxidase [Armatimonadota bacterium]